MDKNIIDIICQYFSRKLLKKHGYLVLFHVVNSDQIVI